MVDSHPYGSVRLTVAPVSFLLLLALCGLSFGQPVNHGLDGAWGVAVSADGAHVYVTSRESDGVSVFAVDAGTGELAFVEAKINGAGGLSGLAGARAPLVSPDGAYVYVRGSLTPLSSDGTVTVFSRDVSTGALTFVEQQQNDVGDVVDLLGTGRAVLSPDGAHLYTTGPLSDSLVVFARSAATGTLTFIESHRDHEAGVDGLDGASDVAISSDGTSVYVEGDGVAAFSRDVTTGTLTLIDVEMNGVGGVSGLGNPTALTTSPDGAHVYAGGSDGGVIFDRDVSTGTLTFATTTHIGGPNPRALLVSPDGQHLYTMSPWVTIYSRAPGTGATTLVDSFGVCNFVNGAAAMAITADGSVAYVAAETDDAVTAHARDTTTGELTFVDAEFQNGIQPVFGKRLFIKNAVPDDEAKNRGTWATKDDGLVVAIPADLEGDPLCRCNEDVRATIRFFSDGSAGSAADTGEIPLPCENWSRIGPGGNPRGYKYRDAELDDGPCKLVIVKKDRMSAKCFGRGPATDFLYDLEPGSNEGRVNVILTLNRFKYCTTFDPFRGLDGTNGKRFRGKNAPAPAACPVPDTSPSGAFLDAAPDIVR